MLYQTVNRYYLKILFKLFICSNLLIVPHYILVISTRYHKSGFEYLFLIPFVCLLLIMLFYKIHGNKFLWLINTIFSGILVFSAWHSVSNFIYLVFYINLGISLILFIDPENIQNQLVKLSKLMIGSVFLIASIQKIVSPQFISGYYFNHEWYNNLVFSTFLSNIGVPNQNSLCFEQWNQLLINGFLSKEHIVELFLPKHESLVLLSKVMTIITLFVESMIALLFLLPSRFKISKFKDFFLLSFLLGTYFIAPVAGFAMILITLGFCQSIHLKYGPILYLFVGLIVLIISFMRILQIEELFIRIAQFV